MPSEAEVLDEPTDRTDTATSAYDVADEVRVVTLGTFAVEANGAPIDLPRGLPRQALKLTIVHGGLVHGEVMMECLWPGIDLTGGRKGIRNILSRLRNVGVPTLTRDDEILRLADGVRVDAIRFQKLADRALTAPTRRIATRQARQALAWYQGTFLPGDRYVDWTEPIRHRLRRRRLAMLDLLARDARERDADLEAVHLMELALEDDPFDEVRSFELAETLIAMGRRGRAVEVIGRADAALHRLGLAPDPAWNHLRYVLTRGRTAPTMSETPRYPTRTPGPASEGVFSSLEAGRSTRRASHHRPPHTEPNHRGAVP